MVQDPCSSQLSKTWSTSVETALLFEADRALCLALLDPTDVTDSEYDKELMALNYQIDQDCGNPHKLKTMTHNLVTIRLVFEQELNHLPALFAVLEDVWKFPRVTCQSDLMPLAPRMAR